MVAKNMNFISSLLICIFTLLYFAVAEQSKKLHNYYGTFVGNFSTYAHNHVLGNVYVIDESMLFIKNFSYDGVDSTAYFWVGNSSSPAPDGILVSYPEYSGSNPPPLETFINANIILRLPSIIKVRDIKYLSVWCSRFTMNFGHVIIPKGLKIPSPRVLPEFSRLAHGLRSDNITVLDSKTFYIPNLHYDGAGPDAYFWVGRGSLPDMSGMKVPNEMNSSLPLHGYEGVDIEIVLPGNLTVFDIDWLAVWCIQYRHNFGYVIIPKDINVPPALGQTNIATSSISTPKFRNCIELLDGRVQVEWELIYDDIKICISGRIQDNQYIAFGLSGYENKTEIIGADVVVIGYNKAEDKFFAEDYYLSDYVQCDGERGICPDHRIGGKNDAFLIEGSRKNGITSVTYQRPRRTNELIYDKVIPEKETTIIAAIGLLNRNYEANAHENFNTITEDIRIDFGGQGIHQCINSLQTIPEIEEYKIWPQMKIIGKHTFTVRIGQTGGMRRYSDINDQSSWKKVWYINELLIPEITVERGQNYTFFVEGGNDKTSLAKYHPFYITESSEGGFGQLPENQHRHEKVYAGIAFDQNNYPYPTAAGRYCEYVHKHTDQSLKTENFKEFFNSLKLECEEGEPAKLVWYVEKNTPDIVYYQCYTHKNLGWKFNVVDQAYETFIIESSKDRFIPSNILVILITFFNLTYQR